MTSHTSVIVVQNPQSEADGSVGIIIPCDCGLTIEEIARKDVPAGQPYFIVPQEQIPSDHTFFGAWEADFSNPDGYGIGPDAWFAEKAAAEAAAEAEQIVDAPAEEVSE
jgi:hypothetical protein